MRHSGLDRRRETCQPLASRSNEMDAKLPLARRGRRPKLRGWIGSLFLAVFFAGISNTLLSSGPASIHLSSYDNVSLSFIGPPLTGQAPMASVRADHNGAHIQPSSSSSSARIARTDTGNGTYASVWKNDYNVVHIIRTRFMQQQPHLVHLAAARLDLFKTFCLPSIQQQTTQDFLWIIGIEPHLNETILDGFLRLVETTPNILVFASRDYPAGFRTVRYKKDKLLHGDLDLLQSYQKASQTHLTIDTRLDADDGLALTYLEALQRDASAYDGTGTTVIYCPQTHVEWQQYSPWDSRDNDDMGMFLRIASPACVTPGLTVAYPINVTAKTLNISTAHNKIQRQIPPCSAVSSTTKDVRHCWTSIGKPGALRARTITSAGMASVVRQNSQMNPQQKDSTEAREAARHQLELRKKIKPTFGVEDADIVSSKRRLEANLQEIVQDALDGHCTIGGSCKQSGKEQLQSVLQQVSVGANDSEA